jgi:hypothetical protein
MRITGIRSRLLEFPLAAPFRPAWGRGRIQTALVLVLYEVGTDTGLVGLGAAHGGPEAQVAIDRFVTPHLIGQDPTEIERLAAIIRDAEILGPPPYCMEIPLWDLLGKAAGLPVHRLWGGGASRVRAYCSTGELRSPAERADDVARLADEGYTAVKLRFHHDDPRDDVAVAEAVRDKVGDAVELMVDANQAAADPGNSGHRVWDFRTALMVARELERLGRRVARGAVAAQRSDPGWPGCATGWRRSSSPAARTTTACTSSSCCWTRGCFDVLQPDAVKSETASAIRHLAAFAPWTASTSCRTRGATGWACWSTCTSPPRCPTAATSSSRTTRPAGSPPPPATACSPNRSRSTRAATSPCRSGPASASSSTRNALRTHTISVIERGVMPACA